MVQGDGHGGRLRSIRRVRWVLPAAARSPERRGTADAPAEYLAGSPGLYLPTAGLHGFAEMAASIGLRTRRARQHEGVCRAKTRSLSLTWCFGAGLGCSMVFADQAADGLPALDPGGEIDDVSGLVQRRPLPQSLVRPMPVVMPHVLG